LEPDIPTSAKVKKTPKMEKEDFQHEKALLIHWEDTRDYLDDLLNKESSGYFSCFQLLKRGIRGNGLASDDCNVLHSLLGEISLYNRQCINRLEDQDEKMADLYIHMKTETRKLLDKADLEKSRLVRQNEDLKNKLKSAESKIKAKDIRISDQERILNEFKESEKESKKVDQHSSATITTLQKENSTLRTEMENIKKNTLMMESFGRSIKGAMEEGVKKAEQERENYKIELSSMNKTNSILLSKTRFWKTLGHLMMNCNGVSLLMDVAECLNKYNLTAASISMFDNLTSLDSVVESTRNGVLFKYLDELTRDLLDFFSEELLDDENDKFYTKSNLYKGEVKIRGESLEQILKGIPVDVNSYNAITEFHEFAIQCAFFEQRDITGKLFTMDTPSAKVHKQGSSSSFEKPSGSSSPSLANSLKQLEALKNKSK
jgi:HD-GYP domain-containing protein (c-di-GMP phosphodiesterase class II)